MSFRFWRRIRLAPGITLNLSKSGGSLSFGPRGAKVTIGGRGRRATVGIPGTGLFYTVHDGGRGKRPPPSPRVAVADRLSMGFFKRLITPDDEEALVDGLKALYAGDEEAALAHFKASATLADSAFLAGMLTLKRERLSEAEGFFKAALSQRAELGRCFARYGIDATVSLPITDEVAAHVGPSERGVLLALVEVYQRADQVDEATACLERLQALAPEDPVVRLSLVELLRDAHPHDRETAERIVKLTAGVENETPVHTALLLYKARALRALGLDDAAATTLTRAWRRKKGRSEDLLRTIRYERALTYEALGRKARARKEFEAIYAEAPSFEDVAERVLDGRRR